VSLILNAKIPTPLGRGTIRARRVSFPHPIALPASQGEEQVATDLFTVASAKSSRIAGIGLMVQTGAGEVVVTRERVPHSELSALRLEIFKALLRHRPAAGRLALANAASKSGCNISPSVRSLRTSVGVPSYRRGLT